MGPSSLNLLLFFSDFQTMENNSERSSETSSLHEGSQPPSIHIEEFLME